MEKISRIIFICTGNQCRSPMASGIAKREVRRRGLDVEISSAGTGATVGYPASVNARTACAEIGIDISAHRARQVEDCADSSETLFVCMTERHAAYLHRRLSIPAERIMILGRGIPDPFGQPLDVYRTTCRAIEEAVIQLFDRLDPLFEHTENTISFEIRDMTAEDIPNAAAIENEAFGDPWSASAFADEINNPLADMIAAVSGKALCGYACMISAGGVSEIPKICVAQEFRRRGIGRALMSELEKRAVQLGSDELTLEVRVSNKAAQELYSGQGFVSLGIRPGFYSEPREDAVIMTKTLAAQDEEVGN